MDKETNTQTITVNKNNNKKPKKDRSLWPVILVLVILMTAAAFPVGKYLYYTYTFNAYMDDLRDSFLHAENFKIYEFTAEYQGKKYEMDKHAGSWIFTELNFIGLGTKCEKEDVDDPFLLDFGDGSSLLMGISELQRLGNRTVKCLYLEYTYPSGKKYCYKTDETEFHYLLDPVIEYCKANTE